MISLSKRKELKYMKVGDILVAKYNCYMHGDANGKLYLINDGNDYKDDLIVIKDKEYKITNIRVHTNGDRTIQTASEVYLNPINGQKQPQDWLWVSMFPFYTTEELREIKLNKLLDENR